MTTLSGVVPITLTPFDRFGQVDRASIPRLTDFYRQAGASALTVLGIMGEAHKLSDRERDVVVASYLDAAGEDLPVIVGVSAPGTLVAVQRARDAETAGASAIMVAPPPGTRSTGLLVDHFRAVADSVTIPVVLQDEPVSTGVQMPAAFITELARTIPQIRYVKVEEPPTPTKVSQILASQPDLGIFGGLGGLYFFEELGRGAVGVMTGFAYPDILVRVYDLFRHERLSEAREYFYRYLPLIRFEAQLGVGGVAVRKLLFQKRGIIHDATVRMPAPTVDEATLRELSEMLDHLGLGSS